ncbi:MAG TPA: response regulator transcription factor [Acidimicrobiales bacterium]|nr:response regulator transcription factor [Acidimicrobiales bacterium]
MADPPVTRRLRPEVVLMDVRMPGRDGIDATAEIVAGLDGAVRVLVLTTFDDDEALYGALSAGASGFLLKNSTPEEVLRAIRRVAAGDAVLDPAVAGRVFARFARPGGPANPAATVADPRALDRLTERERDVLALVARGLTNAEVAHRLGVGEATSKTHVSRVLSKLGVRDRVQAVIYAYEPVSPPMTGGCSDTAPICGKIRFRSVGPSRVGDPWQRGGTSRRSCAATTRSSRRRTTACS